jgi:hypothetical protein
VLTIANTINHKFNSKNPSNHSTQFSHGTVQNLQFKSNSKQPQD